MAFYANLNVMKPLALLRYLTVLCVEDDPVQRTELNGLLQDFFQELVVADCGETALQIFQSRPIHIVITDLRMPGMSGLELIAAIRQQDRQTPILITSAHTDTADLLAATRLRLVDYLLKPLSWAQLKTALERCAEELLAEGRLFIPLDAHTTYCVTSGCLHRMDEIVPLTPREQTLLNLLATHRQQWLSQERLLAALYHDSGKGSEGGLKNLFLRLRQKIGKEVIINHYGVGYRLR